MAKKKRPGKPARVSEHERAELIKLVRAASSAQDAANQWAARAADAKLALDYYGLQLRKKYGDCTVNTDTGEITRR